MQALSRFIWPAKAVAADSVSAPPATTAELDRHMEDLSARKAEWAKAPLDLRIAILKEIRARLLDVGAEWAARVADIQCVSNEVGKSEEEEKGCIFGRRASQHAFHAFGLDGNAHIEGRTACPRVSSARQP